MFDIIIVGCGATGSNLIALIAQYAVSQKNIDRIVLVDQDIVESKNFVNQKFTKKDLGKNKARVLSNRYNKLGINITYVDKFIENQEDLFKITKESQGKRVILIGAVDNNKTRVVMNDFFNNNLVPTLVYIDTGNGDGLNRKGQTVCGVKENNIIIKLPVGDYYPAIYDEEVEEIIEVSYKCSDIVEHPQNFATNVFSSTIVFMMVNNIVSGIGINKCNLRFDTDKISII